MTMIDQDLIPEPLPPERRGWRTADLARASIVALAVWFGLQMLWTVSSLVFLVFLATLFGLAVARGVDYVEKYKVRRGVASALIVFGTLSLIGGGLALSAPTLIESGKELQTQFPAALTKLQNWVDSKGSGVWGSLIKQASKPAATPSVTTMPTADGSTAVIVSTPVPVAEPQSPQPPAPALNARGRTGAQSAAPRTATEPRPSEQLKDRITQQFSKLAGYLFSAVGSVAAVAAAFVLLMFLAIYIGAEPEVYRGWLLATIPATSRPHMRLVLGEVSKVLRKWLVTQLIAMIIIGVMSTVVLLLLGVQAPYALGFIAGLLEFIPTVGPIMSAVPAIIMGFTESPSLALKVGLAYWAIQFVENNLLIPYLMRGEMDLPPAITLVAQALMTLLFGFVGLLVAVPLTATVLVPLRMLAERENAREKVIVKLNKLHEDTPQSMSQSTSQSSLHKDMPIEGTLDKADRGPARVAANDKEEEQKPVDVMTAAGEAPDSEST
ncbi:MAG TPA: AI-2E family transporter [Gemmatimonas sp.]|nr:AI-2E family transporter [Gemmatimonas sp.]